MHFTKKKSFIATTLLWVSPLYFYNKQLQEFEEKENRAWLIQVHLEETENQGYEIGLLRSHSQTNEENFLINLDILKGL